MALLDYVLYLCATQLVVLLCNMSVQWNALCAARDLNSNSSSRHDTTAVLLLFVSSVRCLRKSSKWFCYVHYSSLVGCVVARALRYFPPSITDEF
jgi:hypothetical protein